MSPALPVQRLGSTAKEAFLSHLLALDATDARLRFGTTRSAAAIAAYVDGIDFATDTLFGVYDARMALAGATHLAFSGELAEIGVSVLPTTRRRGIGSALVARATLHARNRAVPRLFMHCLAENATMIRIAHRAGMRVAIEQGDADAHLALASATPLSLASEALADRVALYDHALRMQVETWRRIGVAFAEPMHG